MWVWVWVCRGVGVRVWVFTEMPVVPFGKEQSYEAWTGSPFAERLTKYSPSDASLLYAANTCVPSLLKRVVVKS